MSFNKKTDDYLEGEIDFNSGVLTDLTVKKKKKSRCFEIFNIFKEVLGVYPLNWNTNKTQRTCAENLSTERTTEQIKNALVFYKEKQEEKYCPTIRSPYDLDSKWDKLTNFKKRSCK